MKAVRTLEMSDSHIISLVSKPDIQTLVARSEHYALLDEILVALWSRPKDNRSTLRLFLQTLNTGHFFMPLLLHRIKYHTRSRICPIYSWMLRNGLFEHSLVPNYCLKCVAHTMSYGILPDRFDKIRAIERLFEHPRTRNIIEVTRTYPEAASIFHSLSCSLLEQRVRLQEQMNQLYTHIPQPTTLLYHPFVFGHSLTPQLKSFLKLRTNTFKEELVQRTWHPDRFLHWCLDLEEKKEIMDLPDDRPPAF